VVAAVGSSGTLTKTKEFLGRSMIESKRVCGIETLPSIGKKGGGE
jgi:hypothetical protein